ncbi:MAG: helix-turn-helix transcriptional regulator [Planctomycetes bacterium]|nr:helix-turn-helix transcriptional regulator [Planctomycetota bacterium]
MVIYGVSVIAGGLHRCDPAWSRPQRFRREYSRIYVPVSGNARFCVDDQWTDLVPGLIYFIPGQPDNRQVCERRMSVHWLHLTPQSLPMAQAIAGIRRVVSWPESRWRWWRPIYRRIAEHTAGGGTALASSVHAFALAVTSAAIAATAIADGSLVDARERLAPAIDLLERRFPDPVPVPALARASEMSLAHFRRRFTAAYGSSPRAFIARRRLEAAASLLASEERSIAEVAAACGYDDPFHFSRAFHRFHRLSPSAFRLARQRGP